MSNVAKLEDYKPRIIITDPLTGDEHSVPLSVVDGIISGRIKPARVECWQPLLRALLLDFVGGYE